ncbi:hypothetical protein [Chryseobacterium sp. MA9]|uniref:hypothetical protein n=1 Tax=Chryseobacterium sp. MA9 TaxID=2966625 RepID=UPI0021044394|nr:hypothetical protein [Chryseobacterium sp. MA9]UTX46673.1 hypothetical protein KIK00_11930 [Chryseobacterium sp. MA9]
MGIEKIENKNFLIRSEYLLDEIILTFGSLCFSTEKKIKRVYFSLELTPENIQPSYITKEEFEKSPKENFYFLNDEIEGYYSRLNYEDFTNDFDFQDWGETFLETINNTILNEFLFSVKQQCEELSDIKSKMFFQDLLNELYFSDYFLDMFMQSEGCNLVRKTVCESFKTFNKELYENLRLQYKFIFSDLIESYDLSKLVHVEDIKNDRLRDTHLYRFGCLFANGTFIIEGSCLMYENVKYDNANGFSSKYSRYFGFKHTSFSSYIKQTLNDLSPKNNIFHKDNFKYVKLIYQDFKEQKKNIAPFFERKYQELLMLTEQD